MPGSGRLVRGFVRLRDDVARRRIIAIVELLANAVPAEGAHTRSV